MKYLITDPCNVVPDNKWKDFLDRTFGEIPNAAKDYKIKNFGTIIASSQTSNTDGYVKVTPRKLISIDSGLVCIVQLEDNVTLTVNHGDATTSNKEQAKLWYKRAQCI